MYRTLGTMLLTAALFLAAHGSVEAQKAAAALQAAKAVRMLAVQEAELMARQGKATSGPQADGGDEDLLRSVSIPTDGPGLLNYFRLRSLGQATPERLADLIEQLGDKSPIAAQKASGELASIGAA